MASLHDNAYYRARIQSLRDYAELSAGKKKFYQNGLVPKSERANFDKYVDKHTVEYDNSPLTFTELMTYNTWYEQHPEKIAGTMVEGSSLYFPVVVRGNKLDVMAMFKAALSNNKTKTFRELVEENGDNNESKPKYKVGDKFALRAPLKTNKKSILYIEVVGVKKYEDLHPNVQLWQKAHRNEYFYLMSFSKDLTLVYSESRLDKYFELVGTSETSDDELEMLELEAEALEMELKLDGGLGRISNKAKKRALETASLIENSKAPQTVVSSAMGAKVLKKLDNLAEKIENLKRKSIKTFIGKVAEAIGAEKKGSKSEYATFETINGNVVTIRLADHNATVSTFDNRNEENGISIVVSHRANKGIDNNGKAHIVEFYYSETGLRRADGKPLAKIVRSIKQSLYSGEFKDTTGLAEKQEVNIQKI